MQPKIYDNLEQAQESILKQNPQSIFLVTGKDSFNSSGARARLSELLKIPHTQYNDFSSNPKLIDAQKGIELYNKLQHDLILAIGGGTPIDMAKLIKGLAQTKDSNQALMTNQPNPVNLPLIAVPTTSGSGSESTPFAVCYINNRKCSLEHPTLLPDQLVLDSTLTYSLKPRQTAISGLDALAQSIESYWAVKSTPESLQFSHAAIDTIIKNLENTVNEPNPERRHKMLISSNWAGRAIAAAKTTACHAMSYPMTAHYGVSHGHAVALTLGPVLEYNSKTKKSDCNDSRGPQHVRHATYEISKLLGADNPERANQVLGNLMESLGLETKLTDLGITNTDFIIDNMNEQRMANNPRNIGKQQAEQILSRIA